MRCLIIDDNPDDRSLTERIIKGAGHRATSVSSGDDAVQLLGQERFDVAIVDLRLSGMTGMDTLRSLRALDPHLRLLVVSGYEDQGTILAAVEAGADGYILKDDLPAHARHALQEIRAGKSPFSGRVGAILLAELKSRLRAEPAHVGKRRNRLADASGELIVARIKLGKPE